MKNKPWFFQTTAVVDGSTHRVEVMAMAPTEDEARRKAEFAIREKIENPFKEILVVP